MPRTPGPGRPSLGPRKDFKVRLQAPAATVVVAECTAADLNYQDYLEALVAIGLRHKDELPEHLKAQTFLQEVMPESA